VTILDGGQEVLPERGRRVDGDHTPAGADEHAVVPARRDAVDAATELRDVVPLLQMVLGEEDAVGLFGRNRIVLRLGVRHAERPQIIDEPIWQLRLVRSGGIR
jgi:hypothetical protein